MGATRRMTGSDRHRWAQWFSCQRPVRPDLRFAALPESLALAERAATERSLAALSVSAERVAAVPLAEERPAEALVVARPGRQAVVRSQRRWSAVPLARRRCRRKDFSAPPARSRRATSRIA